MKRYINIWLIANAVLTLNAQQYEDQSRSLNFGENYVKTTTMLDASANQSVTTIQFFDGLGRPSELVEGGISTGGRYLHSYQLYDNVGREYIRLLPAVGSTSNSPKGFLWCCNTCQQNYNDTGYFSQTTYDALGRSTFISTPGQNWEGKGKTIEYVTNGNNEVKRYRVNNSIPALNGRYPAGSLTGERVIDEDGIAITTYKDLTGRIVMERRGDNDDTYFVYDAKGLLCFILQPMYQDSPVAGYRFRYANDAQGRCTSKTLPGCSAIKYWYDGANRIIAKREPLRGARLCTHRYYYDGLGRLVVQGRTVHIPQNANTPIITSRTPAAGTAEIGHTGYYVDAARIPQDLQLEIVNYYDDYAFLSSGIFTDSIPSGNFQASSPVCASTLKTGDITATSDGHLLARVYYYDERGRVADTRENLLGGEFLRTTTSYSFTDKPTSTSMTLTDTSCPSIYINETYTYDNLTDKLKYHDLSSSGFSTRVASYTYNNLGRLTVMMRNSDHFGIENTYNIHGWLTGTRATIFSYGYTPSFQQELSYETGSGTPCFNGNISAMRWKSIIYSSGHGYKFFYDNRNRLTEGRHTDYDFNDYSASYTERMSYNRNSAITQLTRRAGTIQPVDSLYYYYNGNKLTSIGDYGTPVNTNGSFEFQFSNSSPTYTYNSAGDLTRDGNKGLTKINYDYLGHPIRLQFRNGNVIKYVYAADGRKLREKHITAVDGLTVQMGNTLELTPAQTMAVDSMDYAGNLRFTRQRISSSHVFFNLDYHFDGGYLSVTPPNSTSQTYYNKTTYFFIRDHQGNNRLVVDGSDNIIKQSNEYYPHGGLWNYFSTDQGFQPYKYNGKELDRVHGLDWYDYGARRYDPAYCLFTQIDPLCEDTPHLNPYAYCAGNPVRYVDPDGRDWVLAKYGSDSFYFFDDRIHSQEDISENYYGGSTTDNTIQYFGSDGSVKNEDGKLLYKLNDDGTYSDAKGNILSEEVDKGGIHIGNKSSVKINKNNLYGFYLGPHNPKQNNGKDSYALPPIDNLDYAAFLHDKGYDGKDAVGVKGALFNCDVASDDFKLAMRSYLSSFGTTPLSKKYIVSMCTAYSFGSISLIKYYLRKFIK